MKFENVPLSCGYMDQVEKKSLKDCIVLINIQPALCHLTLLIPLYNAKKKFFKVCLVVTLNLCLRVPDKMQKTRGESDPFRLRKLSKSAHL